MSTEILSQLWPMLLTLIFLIIWSIRLESKVLYSEKELNRQDHEINDIKSRMCSEHKEIDLKFDAVASALTGIRESLARIEGRLSKNE